MYKNVVIICILSMLMVSAVFYGFNQSGSPFEIRQRRFDQQRTTNLQTLTYSIDTYYREHSVLPESLNVLDQNTVKDLLKDPETGKDIVYAPLSGGKYQLCTDFSFDSKKDVLGENLFPHIDPKFKHSSGHYCFDLKTTVSLKAPVPKNPICTTLNGKMIENVGEAGGTIGCDILVDGEYDLSKSYCQGQKTLLRKNLTRDAFGRQGRYYATLKTTDATEEVRVFVYSLSGTKIECFPYLNK